jgi:flagellar assembly protein FliH
MGAPRRILRDSQELLVTPVRWLQTGSAPPPIAPFAPPSQSLVPGGRRTEDQQELDRKSYERGQADGIAAGRAQADAELRPVLEQLGKTLSELSSLRPKVRKSAEEDLVKLSLAIARRVLHRELTLDPESISGLVKVALDKLGSREVSRVRLHPDHEAVVRALLERYGAAPMEIARDASLQRGDIRFETPQGTLDASIESQLREIERGFADRLNR